MRLSFGSDHVIYMHLFVFFFYSIREGNGETLSRGTKQTDTRMNNGSSNLRGSNMYDLWIINVSVFMKRVRVRG